MDVPVTSVLIFMNGPPCCAGSRYSASSFNGAQPSILMGWISCCCSPTTASLRLLILSAVFSHMHISQCFCELVSSHRYRRFPRGLDRHSFSGLTGHLRTSPSKESFETHHNYHTKQLLLQCCPSYWGGYTQLCPRKSQWDISMPSHCMWCLKSSDASWT